MRVRRGKRGISRRSLLALVLLGLPALYLAWLVVSAALVTSFSPRMTIAAALTPDHPDIVFRLARDRLTSGGGTLSDDHYRLVTKALRRDPMAADPFALFAARSTSADGGDHQRLLLEEARRRNPRLRLARLLLIERYLRDGKIDMATDEIAVVTRLIPSSRQLLVGQLARLALEPRTRPAVIRAIAADPLLERVLEELARQDADPDIIMQLARAQTGRDAGSDVAGWQALLINSMVRRGEIEPAYRLWMQFSGVRQRSGAAIYDAEFRGLPGSPPFNWELTETETGSAELSRGSLMVDYFGRNSGPLASQLLQLPPGRYRIRFQAEGDANGQGSQLVWRVVCHGDEPLLLELPVVEVTSASKRFSAIFTVPQSGCRAQWLRLDGVSAEFPTTQAVAISGLRLERDGPQS